jgi:hypothetical protein
MEAQAKFWANFAFRAVKIEPGQHSIRFSYQPLTIDIGFPLSDVTSVCVIVFVIVCGLVAIPPLGSHTMANCVLGILRRQALELRFGLLVLEMRIPGADKDA